MTTPAQRRVAEALGQRVGVPIANHPIPQTAQLRRRWLGIDPPTVFERRVAFEHEGTTRSWPVWRVWLELDKQRRQAELATYLPDPVERLSAYADAWLWRPYGIWGPGDTDALIDQVGASGASWAQSCPDMLIGLPFPRPQEVHGLQVVVSGTGGVGLFDPPSSRLSFTAAFAALVPLARAGRFIERRWEPLIPYTSHSFLLEVLAAVAADRREEIMLAGLAQQLDNGAIKASFRVLPTYPYASVAERTRDLLFGPGMRGTYSAKELKPWFAKWEEVCATSAILAPFAKPEAKAPKGKSPAK